MWTTRRNSRAMSLSFATVLLLTGCVDWQPTKKLNPTEPAAKAAAKASPKPPVRKEEALRQFEQKRDDAQYEAAVAQWRQGENEACRELLTKLLARNPDHLQARLLMSEYHLLNTTPLEAMEHAKLAIARNPNDAQANHSLAVVLDAQGSTDSALPYYLRAVELAPNNEVFKLSLQAAEGLALAGVSEPKTPLAAGEPATVRVESPLKAASKQNSPSGANPNGSTMGMSIAGPSTLSLPGDIAARAAEIKGARMAGEQQIVDDQERRRNSVKRVAYLETVPEPAGSQGRGQADTSAMEALRRSMAADPFNTQLPIRAAVSALQNEQPERAVELAKAGLAEYPDCAALHRTLGAAYYRLGDCQRAEESLQQALSLDKANASTYFLLGCVVRKLGDAEAAEQHFQQARLLDPKYGAQIPR